MKKNPTIHEVKDKPKIVVDKNSPAAFLISKKFIDPRETYQISGSSVVEPSDDYVDEGGDDETEGGNSSLLKSPAFNDIYLKYNGSFENVNSANKYGKLYNVSGTSRALVELEFKVMIPLSLVDIITGIEILSDNEAVQGI
jgi:hypothetical protein